VDRDFEEALMNSGRAREAPDPQSNQDLRDQVVALQTMVQDLDLKLRQVMADNEADCIKFDGLRLRSEIETGAWIITNFSEMHYSLIFYVYGMLEAIEDEGATNQSELLRDMKK
jgi:hypothetical protein